MDSFVLHLKNWLDDSPNRNIPILARKTGISPSTIRRWINGETKPTEAYIRKVLTFTCESTAQFMELWALCCPDAAPVIKTLEKTAQNSEAVPDSIDYYLKDSLNFEIWAATSHRLGFCYNTLIKRLGFNGKKRIDSLIQEGNLRLEEGRLYTKRMVIGTYESVIDAIKLAGSLVKDNLDKYKGAYLYVARYTDEEIREIGDALRNVMEIVDRINERKDLTTSVSEKPTIISFLMGSIDGEEQE